MIDLRKNQGGASSWSLQFAEALWGKARVEVGWRASPENTHYVFSMADTLDKEGDPGSAARARARGEGMRAALVAGRPFHVEKPGAAPLAAGAPDGPPFTRPVYVIVPGDCASSCLNAIDVFTCFPNTVLVGAPSAADSICMEVRTADLASGLASVIVPTKAYVNRKRGNGAIYQPKILVRDVVWSYGSLLRTVEADLAGRGQGPPVPGG